MNPPTEQLIRDYLNRVSVAARGQLGPDQRRALVARTREFIEQHTRAVGHTDSADVSRLLADLGDPAALVQREREQLAGPASAAETGGPGTGERRRRRGMLADLMAARAAVIPPGSAVPVPEPAEDAPLTGELQPEIRPFTSRWKPGAPVVPRQPRPPGARRAALPRRLPRHGRNPSGTGPADAAAYETGEPGERGTAEAVPPLPADARPGRPQWPSLTVRSAGEPPGPVSGTAPDAGPAGTNGTRPASWPAAGSRPMTGQVVPEQVPLPARPAAAGQSAGPAEAPVAEAPAPAQAGAPDQAAAPGQPGLTGW